LGVSIKSGEVERNQRLFNRYLGIPEERLQFRLHNLYELPALKTQFDQIIYSEVLEHIKRDREMCQIFWDVLKPGGTLHLCCPNADHPDNRTAPLDLEEKGGHVRPGYTAESYRQLLEPIGFQLSDVVGLGGPIRQTLNKMLMAVENFAGLPTAVVVFVATSPLLLFDSAVPRIPYSLYVKATKPGP
jgi:SAM-dependent methyltransferase